MKLRKQTWIGMGFLLLLIGFICAYIIPNPIFSFIVCSVLGYSIGCCFVIPFIDKYNKWTYIETKEKGGN